MFDLNQLRCFVTVAEELHFGRAASRLNMTQPPLSRQIQVLEHIIDAALLERTSRSVKLTPAGRSFLPEARRILKMAESAAQVARRIASGKSGSLKIGFTAAAAYGFMPELLAACRTRLPEADLSLSEMVSGDQIEALAFGQIDAGLLRPPIARPEFATKRVVAEQLLAAVPRRHRLASADSVSIKDFDGQPFIMYSPSEARYFHDLLVAQFMRAEVLPRYVQHLSQIHSILSMVRAGLGVAIVPEAASSLRIADVKLRPLKLRNATPVELFLVWRREHDNPLLPALVEIASSLAALQQSED
ncbi:putative transcriptional regulatory protein, LysR family [Bradyrhizobium sp. STM 3843]|uniref:LysR substrate-binding domain-containing protein n=1 Tax=Bradyrhizobium sp. STM 3843 TaxID=551947 RepID=UPI00024036DB|nr:LysR substrate-binding domain-containing protein [Bradyrhizobium sp. STM 3843]CCE09603.1 putative transcriptional regulatory protein, LysR family [Bradyrhizobium sp. STM 3843]